MRSEGASYARVGELELRFEPQLPSSPKGAPTPPMSGGHSAESPDKEPGEEDDEQRSLDAMLHSSGVNPAAIAEALKRARVAAKAI
jgi:hypothetical protein